MLLKHQRFRLSTRSECDVDSSVQHQPCVLYLVKTPSISINLAPVLVLRQFMTLTPHPSYFRSLVPFPPCKFILMFVQNMMSGVPLTADLLIKVKMYVNAKYIDNVDIFI